MLPVSLSHRFVFLGTIPVVLLYWFAYYVLVKTRKPKALVVNGDNDETKSLLNGNKLSGIYAYKVLDRKPLVEVKVCSYRSIYCFTFDVNCIRYMYCSSLHVL